MPFFTMPITSAFGQNVREFDGALLYFYDTGTTTPKVVFTDSSQRIPHPSPVVADGAGRFPAIFVLGSYDCVLKDKNGVLIWESDNVQELNGALNWSGNFDSLTNAGNYPAGGSQGDWYKVTSNFTLGAASGSHLVEIGDFIICNKNAATGVDSDWDLIKGINALSISDILNEPNLASNSATKIPSQRSTKTYVDSVDKRTKWAALTSAQQGIIIPMYIYPSVVYTNAAYNQVIALAKKYRNIPVIAAINPANGAGSVVDGNYTAAIKRMHGAGIHVVGYITTNRGSAAWGAVPTHPVYPAGATLAQSKADIDLWATLYPEIDGIFVDEMSNLNFQAAADHYRAIRDYADLKGFYTTVANPGATFPEVYNLTESADIFVATEGGYPLEANLSGDYGGGFFEYDIMSRAALVYGQATFSSDDPSYQLLKKYTGWMYITPDVAPNPWDTVSAHLPALFADLEQEPVTDLSLSANLASRSPSQQSVKTYVDHSSPAGMIVAWNPGYYTNTVNGGFTSSLSLNSVAAANAYLNPMGWYVCDGAALNRADSPIFFAPGRYLPNLSDNRFLGGSTSSGAVGGTNVMLDHAHTCSVESANHTHSVSLGPITTLTQTSLHSHGIVLGVNPFGSSTNPGFTLTNTTSSNIDTATATNNTNTGGDQGNHIHPLDYGTRTSSVESANHTHLIGNGAAPAATENRPQYLSTFFIIKVI